MSTIKILESDSPEILVKIILSNKEYTPENAPEVLLNGLGADVEIAQGDSILEDDPDEVKNMDVLSLMKQKLPDTPPPSFELTPVIRPYTAGDPPRKINFPNKSELMKREELLKN